MGYVFYTLKGAAIFVSSVHIYNGLGLITQFMTFPMVYSATIEKGTIDIPMHEYLPGFIYSVIYLATGIFIFKGIESESSRMIKLPTLIFSVTQVIFFVLRGMIGVFPTPILMADLSQSEKPPQWNVYKTIHYLTLTLLGGIVYLFVLFLYLQQLAGPNSNIMDIICISTRKPPKRTAAPPIEVTPVAKEESTVSISHMEPSYSSPAKKSHHHHHNHPHQQPSHSHQRSVSQRRAPVHEYAAQVQYQSQPVYQQAPNVYAQAFDRPPPPRY